MSNKIQTKHKSHTLQGTNISPKNGILKMIFLFPKVGYVNSLEGISPKEHIQTKNHSGRCFCDGFFSSSIAGIMWTASTPSSGDLSQQHQNLSLFNRLFLVLVIGDRDFF